MDMMMMMNSKLLYKWSVVLIFVKVCLLMIHVTHVCSYLPDPCCQKHLDVFSEHAYPRKVWVPPPRGANSQGYAWAFTVCIYGKCPFHKYRLICDFYTPPHKKWQGIMLYPPNLSVHPSVHTYQQVHKGLDFRWLVMYFKWDLFLSHLKSVIYVAKMALCS